MKNTIALFAALACVIAACIAPLFGFIIGMPAWACMALAFGLFATGACLGGRAESSPLEFWDDEVRA